HIEYVPFGEVFIEERNNVWNTPYLFNAKEFDEETGMYYYGARYYDPRLSLWMSTDPLQETAQRFSPYAYAANNPVNAIDPDGNIVIFINGMHLNSGGKSEYWNGVDRTITNWLQDKNTRYYDGSCGGAVNTVMAGALTGNLNPYARYAYGVVMGKRHAKEIYDNIGEKETIKVVAHSMGPAYAKGFISGLQSYAQDAGLKHKIEMEIDLAPFQPHLQKANSDVPTTTISHWRDGIAGPSFMWGAKNYRTGFWKISLLPTTEHSISSFNEEIQKFIPRGNPERGGSEGIWEENGDN
ncbi:RHS repeat-associated core domain-containing protein, partial [uncultured Duncaniella sp.]